jgi:hypothetical protein
MVQDDILELAGGTMPEDLVPLPQFLQSFLLQKYGLPSLLEGHMYAIVECTQVR